MNERVVLLVSSTETLVPAVGALLRAHRGDIVALVVDLGGRGVASARDAAVTAGVRRCHVVDARGRFARECVWPSLRAEAVGRDGTPLTAALGHVAMARGLVDIAVAASRIDVDPRAAEPSLYDRTDAATLIAVV